MTELDPLTEQQVHLFLRIDAAMPTDPVLRAAAEFWLEKRQGKVRPSEQGHGATAAIHSSACPRGASGDQW